LVGRRMLDSANQLMVHESMRIASKYQGKFGLLLALFKPYN
jgi:hypothetical protein